MIHGIMLIVENQVCMLHRWLKHDFLAQQSQVRLQRMSKFVHQEGPKKYRKLKLIREFRIQQMEFTFCNVILIMTWETVGT